MLPELKPIRKQFDEVYYVVRQALSEVPDDRLHWRPGPKANTVAYIVQHIARATEACVNTIESGSTGSLPDFTETPTREQLLQRLEESEQRARTVFEQVTPEQLSKVHMQRRSALGPEVEGPMDGLWFALHSIRHTAYHIGQIYVYPLIWEGEQAA
jgi:uncharacterized damage-inducible protein DinB